MLDLASITGLARVTGLPRIQLERAFKSARVPVPLVVDGVEYVDRQAASEVVDALIGGGVERLSGVHPDRHADSVDKTSTGGRGSAAQSKVTRLADQPLSEAVDVQRRARRDDAP